MSFDCTAFRARRLSRVVTQAFDNALRPFGIKITQLSLLAALVARGPMSVVQLADLLVIDPTTASRATAGVASLGWITVSEGSDARSKRVQLTASGKKIHDAAIGARDEVEKSIRASLRKTVSKEFLDDLENAAAAVATAPKQTTR